MEDGTHHCWLVHWQSHMSLRPGRALRRWLAAGACLPQGLTDPLHGHQDMSRPPPHDQLLATLMHSSAPSNVEDCRARTTTASNARQDGQCTCLQQHESQQEHEVRGRTSLSSASASAQPAARHRTQWETQKVWSRLGLTLLDGRLIGRRAVRARVAGELGGLHKAAIASIVVVVVGITAVISTATTIATTATAVITAAAAAIVVIVIVVVTTGRSAYDTGVT